MIIFIKNVILHKFWLCVANDNMFFSEIVYSLISVLLGYIAYINIYFMKEKAIIFVVPT